MTPEEAVDKAKSSKRLAQSVNKALEVTSYPLTPEE